MKNKISLLFSLTLITLFPSSKPYTKKDIEKLQTLTEVAAFITPALDIADNYLPHNPRTREIAGDFREIGDACETIAPILEAATESEVGILKTIRTCLVMIMRMNPNFASHFTIDNYRDTSLKVAMVIAIALTTNFSFKALKKIVPGSNVRILRRALRVLLESLEVSGIMIAINYIGNNYCNLMLSTDYKNDFLQSFINAVITCGIYENCGEIIALGIEKEEPLEALAAAL